MDSNRILDEAGIEQALEKLLDSLTAEKTRWGNTVLVGVITRGEILARRLSKRIKKRVGSDVPVGGLDTRPYRDDLREEVTVNKSNIPFKTKGKNIILVDDVISTGRTIRAAMDAIIEFGRPASIKTAILIDRGHREFPISCDYVGVKIPTSTREDLRVRLDEVDGGGDRAEIVVK
jgi:pyrimidine operon attenuation protein / uracil phosphoribosyltransferase